MGNPNWPIPGAAEALALEAMDSLAESLDILEAKVAALDRRLAEAETKLEKIVAALGPKQTSD